MKASGLYIRDHTQSDDRIAVLGSEPEAYFYARRRAATKYIYTYPLLARQFAPLGMASDKSDEDLASAAERLVQEILSVKRIDSSNPPAPVDELARGHGNAKRRWRIKSNFHAFSDTS
jgi:hypothetical protein